MKADYYFADCEEPDYSGVFSIEEEAQTEVNDHGGEVIPLCNLDRLKEVTQELHDTQHSLALLMDAFHIYPWCCKAAQNSNGWTHATNCKNWDMPY